MPSRAPHACITERVLRRRLDRADDRDRQGEVSFANFTGDPGRPAAVLSGMEMLLGAYQTVAALILSSIYPARKFLWQNRVPL